MMHKTLIVGICLAPVFGCNPIPPASQGGFDSDDPGSKLYAITRAGMNHDRSSIGHLIDQLDSDDSAVRMMAIIALERIAGTRMGYSPYTSIENRHPAVEAWARAYRNNEIPTSEPLP